MKLVFFGTPPFAASILEKLFKSSHQVVAIVTQPDRPKGRSKAPQMPAVKETALKLAPSLPLLQPEKASTQEIEEQLKRFNADIFVVVAYGEILKQNILDIPPKECVNVHASLLPKYRGAAPIQRAILEGEAESGVSIMYLVRKMDAGDVISQVKCAIAPDMTAGELEEKLCDLGGNALIEALNQIEAGKNQRTPQNESLATLAPKMASEDGKLSPFVEAEKVYRHFRGTTPRPGAYLEILFKGEKKKLKILEAQLKKELQGKEGTFSSPSRKQLLLFCKEGALEISKLQLEGKKACSTADFLNGVSTEDLSL